MRSFSVLVGVLGWARSKARVAPEPTVRLPVESVPGVPETPGASVAPEASVTVPVMAPAPPSVAPDSAEAAPARLPDTCRVPPETVVMPV